MRRLCLGKLGALLLLVVVIGAGSSPAFSAGLPDAFRPVAENERLILYIDEATTEIAVVEKTSGHLWRSNPPGGSAHQRHQVAITYWDPEDKVREMNSFRDSVAYGQFEIVPIEDGVRVRYVMGQEWADDHYIPQMVSQERFEGNILSRLPSDDQEFVRGQYVLIELLDLEGGDVSEALGNVSASEKILGRYVLIRPDQERLSATDRRNLSNHLLTVVSEFREDVADVRSVRAEHLEHLVGNPTYIIQPRLRPWDRRAIVELLKANGYTPLDVQIDHREYGLDEPERNVETFTIVLEYRLDGDSLVVRVPMSEVVYPKDVVPQKTYVLRGTNISDRPYIRENFDAIGGDLVTYPIRTIELLKYFGAAESTENGYILVPDGSGALISLARPTGLTYSQRIFGRDYTQAVTRGQEVPPGLLLQNHLSREQVYLPVFGLKEGEKAFFAIVEEGAALGDIRAEAATPENRWHSVFTSYWITSVANIQLLSTARSQRGGNKSINVYSEGLPAKDIVVRYTFLSGEEADYVGMARYYQRYLVEKYGLRPVEASGDIPFFLELVGAVWKKRLFMGIPTVRAVPLTDFDEARTIVDELLTAGVSRIVLQYSGWQRGGLKGAPPSSSEVEPALGSPKDFSELNAYLEGVGVELFPGVASMSLYGNATRGIDLRRTASQLANGNPVEVLEKSGLVYYPLSPSVLPEFHGSFLKGYRPFGIGRLSLSDLGRVIHADFRKERPVDREGALTVIQGQLEELRFGGGGLELLVKGGNEYALPFAKYVVDAPLESSLHRIITESVPFYQIALHGLVSYAGPPANFASDLRRHLLRSVETGAALSFLWTYEPSSEVKESSFSDLYSTGFADWIDEAVEAYRELNSVLGKVQGERIVDHERILPNVYRTVYENGISVVVNYNREAIDIDGVRIEGEGYHVFEEGAR